MRARRPGQVDREILLGERTRQGRFAGLALARKPASLREIERLAEQIGAEHRETVVQLAVGLSRLDRHALLQHEVAGVESGVHQHDAHAGLTVRR